MSLRVAIWNNAAYVVLFVVSPLLIFTACTTKPYAMIAAPLVAAYYIFNAMASPEKVDGRPWKLFAQHFRLFKLNREYFDMSIELPESGSLDEREMTEFLRSDRTAAYVFGLHPHGVASDFRVLMEGMFYDEFPALVKNRGWRTVAASVLFQIPLVREMALWTGCVDAGRATFTRHLSRGRSIVVVPGGEAEQLDTTFGEERVFIKQRLGFVSLALEHGAKLVPAYVFGESDLYYTSSMFYGVRKFLQKQLKVCINLFWGDMLLCPRKVKLSIVFGDPIDLPRLGKPAANATDDEKEGFRAEVRRYHAIYVEHLEKLFNAHKGRFGYGDRTLIIS